ncbi:MAG TPA: antibiotic biosynthesis monooxygenase [Streptosporangiaceae bacterium]|jgi:quinol monooxygenase YgiN
MSVSLLLPGLGWLGTLAATGFLVARCQRAPSGPLVAWTVAMFALMISLLAQASGYAAGFGPVTLRGMEIGAGIVAPLALAEGLAELAGKSVPARFAARLLLPAIGFIAVVILGSDPLTTAGFSKAWPEPTRHYQILPENLLGYVAPAVLLAALLAVISTLARPHRERAWQEAVPPVAAAAVATLAISLPGLVVLAAIQHHPVKAPVGSLFAPLCIVAAVLTWFACKWAGDLDLDLLRYGQPPAAARDDWQQRRDWARPDETGDFESPGAGADPYDSLYRQEDEGGYGAGYPEGGYDESGYPAAGAYREAGPDTGYGEESGYGDTGYGDSGYSDAGYGDPARGESRLDDDTGFGRPVPAQRGYQEQEEPAAPMFGQIAIYTLLEDRVAEFDKLTKQVVRQVRDSEPDTLVFIVHAVPSAPMQRILYEVYRDREAYEEHKRQPYLARFETERRPLVLATNVIELGLQQAKVSPLRPITDVLSDTGFDLLSDTGFGQPGFAPRQAGDLRGGR